MELEFGTWDCGTWDAAESDRVLGEHRRMVTRADLALHGAALDLVEDRARHQQVVQAPADVPLPHVPPRRPPGEHLIVLRFQGAPGVDQAVADDPLELRALLRKLADDARL